MCGYSMDKLCGGRVLNMNDTVAAVATPHGRGGISVIRISGENAVSVAGKMFFPASGLDISEVRPNSAVYGRIVLRGDFIDDGIAVVYRAPKSFTGEDTVEISCHGGILITERVLKAVFDCGAVQAGPGEFTQRAFLNGKIDLSEAEAVIGLIDAENEERLRLCASHTEGVLRKRTEEIYSRILKLLGSVYVKLDYPDEELEEVSGDEFSEGLERIYSLLCETASTYRQGKAVSEGVKTVLLGKPNTGKSSLLNALAGEDRAIVTPVAGTTRDIIDEKVNTEHLVLRVYDTAGIRESEDEVEKIGVSRALRKAKEAELVMALFDGSRPLDKEDREVLKNVNVLGECGIPVAAVINKSDLPRRLDIEELRAELPGKTAVCEISCKTGEGVESLKKTAEEFFYRGYTDYTSVAVLASARQFSAVCEAMDAVGRALDAYRSGLGADICGLDLEAALCAVGQVDGRTVSGEVADEIFRSFCVGK